GDPSGRDAGRDPDPERVPLPPPLPRRDRRLPARGSATAPPERGGLPAASRGLRARVSAGESRFIGRANVRKRLAPLEGGSGRTTYAESGARIETESEEIAVRPPFGLAHVGEYDRVHLAPLFEALAEDHYVGVLLASLGGYAIGVLDGEA